MPKKNFFSDLQPENDGFGDAFGTDDAQFQFDGSFGELQPMNLFDEETPATNHFAAILQPEPEPEPEPEPALEPMSESIQAPTLTEPESGLEGDFGDLFGMQPPPASITDFDSFFAAQPTEPESEPDAFFASPTDFAAQDNLHINEMQGVSFDAYTPPPDALFVPMEPAPEPAQEFVPTPSNPAEETPAPTNLVQDSFVVPQPVASSAPQADAEQEQDEIFMPQDDFFGDSGMPVFAPSYDKPAAGFASELADAQEPIMPFDIAEPAAQAVAQYAPEEYEQEYVPRRKYKPVFPAPVPSALDELRAGIVRPTSPISDIAMTQVPVVITAAEAAAKEAAAREAALQAAEAAAAAEEEAALEMARQKVRQEAEGYGYEAPRAEQAPAEFGFDGHAAPPKYVQPQDENNFGLEESEPVAFDFEAGIAQESVPVGAPQDERFTRRPAAFDYDAQPEMQEQEELQEQFSDFDFTAQPMVQPPENEYDMPSAEQLPFTDFDVANQNDFAQQNFSYDSDENNANNFFQTENENGAASPQVYAENLSAMLGADNTDTEQDVFGDEMFGSQKNGFNALGDLGDDFGDLPADDPMQANAPNATAFNPFESDEWTNGGDDDDEVDSYDDDDKHTHRRGGKGRSPLPLVITLIVLLVLIGAVVLYVLFGGKRTPAVSSSVPTVSMPVSVSIPASIPEPEPVVDPIPREEWYMALVNKTTVLSGDFAVKTGKVTGGVEVDERIVEPMNQMLVAAKEQGVNLRVVAGYRAYARQEASYKAQVAKFEKQGKAKEEAEKLAAEITAPPGTSEHNLGLSADIQSATSYNYADSFKDSAEAKWLAENAAAYGFIQRYPAGKEAQTGFTAEPWHYRYVGVDQAARIVASGLTLEEYLAQDAPTGIPGAAPVESAPAPEAVSSSTPPPAA